MPRRWLTRIQKIWWHQKAPTISFEAMLGSLGVGVVAIDIAGKVVAVNEAAQELLHGELKSIMGKDFFEACPVENHKGQPLAPSEQPLRLALVSGRRVRYAGRCVCQNQSYFSADFLATPIIVGGKTCGAIMAFRDITQENDLGRAKSEFVSLASHQLRTPLGIMKWYLEAVTKDAYIKNAPSKTLGYIHEIRKSNERVIALVRELLSVSLIEQGRTQNKAQLTNIRELIGDIFEEMTVVAIRRNIKLEFTIKPSVISNIMIDPLRLYEVVKNLIVNALEYTLPLGVVTVILESVDSSMLRISVRDTGMGISKRDKEKLFTKFFRSEQGAAVNAEGTGLGLYIVKSYVEGWGGQVAVTSELGRGSTFSITLPINRSERK